MNDTAGWTPREHFEWRLENLKGAIQFARETIRSLILINGAAAAGLLTFYGSIVDKAGTHVEANTVSTVMLFFGVGVGAAVLSSILAYAAQRIVATVSSTRLEMSLAVPALILAIASAVFFFAGIMQASTALP